MNKYAPEYSKSERFKILLMHLAWAVPLFSVTKLYFLPWFKSYSENAQCYNYGTFSGYHVVFYTVFIVLPLLPVITLFLIEGKRNIKIIKIGQNPLEGEKVFRRTKYKYGMRAKIQPYLFFTILLFLVGLSVRGYFWANEIIVNAEIANIPCTNS